MNTYLLYDPALNGAYTQLILQQQYPLHVSLFAGTKDEGLTDVAPYLFLIDDAFARQVMQQQLIELQAVVLMASDFNLEDVAVHLRQFIYQTINSREYFFRFWDGRVLRKFLPTCDKEQLKTFFEGLQSLSVADEADAGQLIQYRQERGKLFYTTVSAEAVFGKPVDSVVPAPVSQEQAFFGQPVKPVKKGRTFLS